METTLIGDFMLGVFGKQGEEIVEASQVDLKTLQELSAAIAAMIQGEMIAEPVSKNETSSVVKPHHISKITTSALCNFPLYIKKSYYCTCIS